MENKYELPEDVTREEIEETIGALVKEVEYTERATFTMLLGVLGITAGMTLITMGAFKSLEKDSRIQTQALQTRIYGDSEVLLDTQRSLLEGAYDSRKFQEARNSLDDYIANNRISRLGDQNDRRK